MLSKEVPSVFSNPIREQGMVLYLLETPSLVERIDASYGFDMNTQFICGSFLSQFSIIIQVIRWISSFITCIFPLS